MVEPEEQPSEERQALAELVGTVLGDRYRLEQVLGAGGMGAVFDGRDLRLGRPVAVKVMQPGYARDAEYVKRFLREAQAASLIRHRNVVVVLDYGEGAGGIVYSVMERLFGQDLEEHLRGQPGQRMAWLQACGLLAQIASGLRAAHGQGVIHRDVKPANCFLTTEDDEPVVKVVDFGIAKLGEGLQTQQLTGTGNVLGTPSYTAPEMVLTGGPASPRSDVYSLGVVAYRMLTGRLPFTGKTAFEVMHHACILPVLPMREAGVEVPAAVEALVLAMLSKKPEERPADMVEVRQRLATLGREAGGVPAAVEGAASSSLRLEVAARTSGAGEVTRTEVLDSGKRAPVAADSGDSTDRTTVRAVAVGTAAADMATERTEVVIGTGFREPTRRPLAPPVVERTEVLDSGKVERPQPKSAGWLVGVGVLVLAALGTIVWVVANGDRVPDETTEASPTPAVSQPTPMPEPEVKDAKVVDPVPSDAQPTRTNDVMVEPDAREDEPNGEAGAVVVELPKPAVDDEATPPGADSKAPPPEPPAPAGPPSDRELERRIARKIKSQCAADLAGKSATVFFEVTSSGYIKGLSAIPKNAAGECAKRQVVGTRFRTRRGSKDFEIKVGRE